MEAVRTSPPRVETASSTPSQPSGTSIGLMSALPVLLAAHPIRKKPYNAIRFVRTDGNGRPLFRVAKDPQELGAAAALKRAFETYGGHCFHCRAWMPAQPLSQDCTRDHLRPRCDGGADYLHNLVLACGPCNRAKGRRDAISFNVEASTEYLKALDAHLVRCVDAIGAT